MWLLVAVIVVGVAATTAVASLWTSVSGLFRSPLALISVVPDPHASGVVDVVVENSSDAAAVITSIGVEVVDFEIKELAIGDSTSLPISSVVNTRITTQRGLVANVSHPNIQLLAKSPERLQLVIGSLPRPRPALIIYTLVLQIQYGTDGRLRSEPFQLRVAAPPAQ
jgi:hypothetical protein